MWRWIRRMHGQTRACSSWTRKTCPRRWRMKKTQLTKKLQKEICQLTTRYGRMNWA
jgi:hypothetical protein